MHDTLFFYKRSLPKNNNMGFTAYNLSSVFQLKYFSATLDVGTKLILQCTDLTVAIASQLRDEAHVVFPDLNHLFTDIVLGAAGIRRTRPPAARERKKGETEQKQKTELSGHVQVFIGVVFMDGSVQSQTSTWPRATWKQTSPALRFYLPAGGRWACLSVKSLII